MQKHVRDNRLKTLYQVIGGIPSAVIDMDSWRNNANFGDPDDKELIKSAKSERNCGTTACALGWACAYPTFKRAGLRWDTWMSTPAYKNETDFAGGGLFFGITEGQAEALFSPTYGLGLDKRTEQKYVFLKRLRRLMVDLEIITPERSLELEAEENAEK
jgi:hypothetical protein